MRSHSGDDEKRNNWRDPTVKDKEQALGASGEAVLDEDAREASIDDTRGQRTTGLGSGARKDGERD